MKYSEDLYKFLSNIYLKANENIKNKKWNITFFRIAINDS